MVYFNKTEIDLGTVALNSVHNLEYEFTGDASEIQEVKATCGCTAKITKQSNKVTAQFTANNTGAFTKTINVFFVNRAVIPLTIKGIGE